MSWEGVVILAGLAVVLAVRPRLIGETWRALFPWDRHDEFERRKRALAETVRRSDTAAWLSSQDEREEPTVAETETATELPDTPDGLDPNEVNEWGEDGAHLIQLGHVDKVEFFAACQAYAQREWHMKLADEDWFPDVSASDVQHCYARPSTHRPWDPEEPFICWAADAGWPITRLDLSS